MIVIRWAVGYTWGDGKLSVRLVPKVAQMGLSDKVTEVEEGGKEAGGRRREADTGRMGRERKGGRKKGATERTEGFRQSNGSH